MEYWYPAQERVVRLAAELRGYEQTTAALIADIDACIPHISAALSKAARTRGFPKRQIPQWVWIASQLRLQAGEGGPAALQAGAALTFLEKKLGALLSPSDVQELNWVLESTVQQLSALLEPEALRSCLSPEELDRIEDRLASYSNDLPFDVGALRAAVGRQMGELSALSTGGHLRTLESKVEALFVAAERAGDGRAARAALRYLADEQDVVCDSHGFLGLLDDVYVIEWAYAVTENQTRCLPLLQTMLQDYPYVADLALVGEPARALDRYSQYVACATLESLFRFEEPSLLVVREAAAYPCLSAFMAGIEAARRQARLLSEELAEWAVGEHVVVGDGTVTLKAVFQGEASVGKDLRFRLGVRDHGSLTVPLELAPYMAKAAAPHRILSTGNEVGEWLKARHLDPLVHLTGASRRRVKDQECILFLGPRHRLDEYINCLRPLGSNPAALLGVRYINSEGRTEDVRGTTTDTPCIYACADAETAYELARHPPAHVGRWRIIVDGAKAGRALYAALTSDGEAGLPPLCVIAELHDRETASELAQRGLAVWYLQDHDVEAPPLVALRAGGDQDPLVRALRRHGNHWAAARRVHESRNDFLERVADWMRRATGEAGGDEGMRGLELLVSAFMQRSLARPLQAPDKAAGDLARGIAAQASLQRLYSPLAAELQALFAGALHAGALVADRGEALTRIASEGSSGEAMAVVCRSAQIAQDCERAAKFNPTLGRCRWVNMEGLRRTAPYDRVIVPGWLDRLSMRELANNGYGARLDFVLYPFEQRWLDSTLSANARWEKRIEQKSLGSMNRVAERAETISSGGTLWKGQTKQRLQEGKAVLDVVQTPDDADVPEFEKLEARAIEAVHRTVMQGREHHPTAKAQLVLFEEPGAYAFLPPGGKVIVLSGRDGELVRTPVIGNDAERMLFRSVASLEPGFLLALPLRGDRDLIDARADQFIEGAAEVRRTSAIWKTALARYFQRTGMEPSAFARRMAEAGHKRDAATIRSWASGSQTIAPRGYRDTVPVLARLTGDAELPAKMPKVLEAIDLIYRARASAAQAIVKELFAGEIDLEADELAFELNGARVRYALHRVRRLEGLRDVPHEVIGRARRLASAAPGGRDASTPANAATLP